MAKQTPYKLYVRTVENGEKVSCGEYIRAKWRNVVSPFKVDDENKWARVNEMVKSFKIKNNRNIIIVGYRGDEIAKTAARKLNCEVGH